MSERADRDILSGLVGPPARAGRDRATRGSGAPRVSSDAAARTSDGRRHGAMTLHGRTPPPAPRGDRADAVSDANAPEGA